MAIREVMTRKGVSFEELSRRLQEKRGDDKPVSRSAISQMINGNPTYKTLVEIADALGVSVSELVSEPTDIKAFVEHGGKVYTATTAEGLEEILGQIRGTAQPGRP